MSYAKCNRKRVVIVDDSRTMQALLEHVLSTRLNYEIVGIAGDGNAAMAMIDRLKPELVTIDLAMPYIDGRQLLKDLEIFPDIRKVVISATACNNLDMKAVLERLGADGCISKHDMSRDPEKFCRVLSAILRAPKKTRPVASPRGGWSLVPPRMEPLVPCFPLPVDERERLVALAALGLANDDPDHRLDLLTEHLVRTTSFSACVMTFIDRDTQWIKSGYGMDCGSTARAQAICNYTICGDEPFIVGDTIADKRFAKLDSVLTGPMIRAYVGHPIVGSSGTRLGAVCLLDTKPRRVSLKELTNLRSIARIAAELVEGNSGAIRQAA